MLGKDPDFRAVRDAVLLNSGFFSPGRTHVVAEDGWKHVPEAVTC